MRYVTAMMMVVGALMAAPARADMADEIRAVRAWAEGSLCGESAPAAATAGLEVRRQDYGEFGFKRSVIKTPLRVGEKKYERGLGTHAVSEILVRLPRPAKRLTADVGVDNNDDTAGKHGSVIFIVEAGGREAFRSGVCKGGQAPVAVDVDLAGAREFVLRVTDADDGPSHDQGDWADAAVTFEGGDRMMLDELALLADQAAGLKGALPFSFTYGGKSSRDLLPTWKRSHTKAPAEDGRERHVVTWSDAATGLEVAAEAVLFADSPAVDWVLRFRNTGAADTPVIAAVLPLDAAVRVPEKGDVILHHSNGSTCAPTDFLPLDQAVPRDGAIDMAPVGGRSSNGRLPFFNLAWPGGGVVGAIGWSGQWSMRCRRDKSGVITLQAGQQTTHFLLHPGEEVRTPRILLLPWKGDDRLAGHNRLRRLILARYSPRIGGELFTPPITNNTWFTFREGNDVTEKNQLECIKPMAPLGVEAFWLDAGWFEGGWPTGVGSWSPKPEAFPRGLKPLGDASHAAGMKFVVWFEPERVHPKSRIGKEHPEFVLRAGDGDGLFNLGDPKARAFLTDLLSKCITDWGIDIYRNDFNIDPLPFWQAADAPDRRGITEIRYVEGLYAMWDDLRRRHPGLAIDNCASGGRRIDLETLSRSVPLWRSDTQCCGHAEPVQDQVQAAGLNLYVPLHTSGCWGFDPYVFRSIATTGTNLCVDTRAETFPAALAKAAIAEAKALRPMVLGDYYPLLAIGLDEGQWCGWQLDRPELGQGMAVFFRRAKSPYAAVDVALRGLDPEAAYEVTFRETYDVRETRTLKGRDLARLRADIGQAPGSLLVTYRRVAK